jgi:hypothetical protein
VDAEEDIDVGVPVRFVDEQEEVSEGRNRLAKLQPVGVAFSCNNGYRLVNRADKRFRAAMRMKICTVSVPSFQSKTATVLVINSFRNWVLRKKGCSRWLWVRMV